MRGEFRYWMVCQACPIPLLNPLCNVAQSQRVTLGLANVSYMDSSGLGILVALYASGNTAGRHFELINLHQRLKESLSVTQLIELRWLGSSGMELQT